MTPVVAKASVSGRKHATCTRRVLDPCHIGCGRCGGQRYEWQAKATFLDRSCRGRIYGSGWISNIAQDCHPECNPKPKPKERGSQLHLSCPRNARFRRIFVFHVTMCTVMDARVILEVDAHRCSKAKRCTCRGYSRCLPVPHGPNVVIHPEAAWPLGRTLPCHSAMPNTSFQFNALRPIAEAAGAGFGGHGRVWPGLGLQTTAVSDVEEDGVP